MPVRDDTGLIVPPPPGLLQSGKDAFYRLRAALDDRLGGIERAADNLASAIRWPDWQAGRPTVLCLARATFNKDVAEMRRRTDLNLAELDTTAVKAVQERWIPPEWRVQTYFTGLVGNELAAFRPYLLKFGRALLRAAGKTHPIDAMMAANIDYWQDEALRLAGQEMNVPFITLCRENYTIPTDQQTIWTRYHMAKFRYSGTAAGVYSEATKKVWDEVGCFAPNTVFVTGAPRFDRWRDIEALPVEQRDCLTLISFASPLYYAPTAYRETAQAIGEACQDVKAKTRIILKIKKQNEIEENRDASPKLVEVGAEFIADWPLFDLLPRSRAVIGYNSMAVAEGLLTDLPVIIPNWGDAVPRERSMFDPDEPLERNCIYFPSSPAEMRDLVKRALTTGLPVIGSIADRRRCFSKVIVAPTDTTSSALVEAMIRRFLPR
ncbi:hypothetical protein [Dongia sedimenti]|uniref:Uncharacterized protein n=1 Tax=Dongia sedimenti TaxID=3064282 RepID=A0ABU0YM77_9PROT|nr:hypothetical protein [Rhodospirillaceae bacterium R-7]